MKRLSDSQRQTAAAQRARSIQAAIPVSKKKMLVAQERLIRERQAQLKDRAAFSRALHKAQGEIAAALLKDNPALQAAAKAFQKLPRPKPRKKTASRSYPPVQPRITSGSVLSLLAPPYSGTFLSATGAPDSTGHANANDGTFGSAAFGDGSFHMGFAGVHQTYNPISDAPMGHFRPVISFDFSFSDFSHLCTAHSDGYIHAAVFDWDGNGDLMVFPPAQQTVTVWQDGTAWFDQHGDSGDDLHAGLIDVAFPLTPGHFYWLSMWTEVDADDAGGTFIGSFANGNLDATCVFAVLEESQT